jgi:hypothetical protein
MVIIIAIFILSISKKGLMAGMLGCLEARRLGGWEARKLGSWEACRQRSELQKHGALCPRGVREDTFA